jgi:hypothetical protein
MCVIGIASFLATQAYHPAVARAAETLTNATTELVVNGGEVDNGLIDFGGYFAYTDLTAAEEPSWSIDPLLVFSDFSTLVLSDGSAGGFGSPADVGGGVIRSTASLTDVIDVQADTVLTGSNAQTTFAFTDTSGNGLDGITFVFYAENDLFGVANDTASFEGTVAGNDLVLFQYDNVSGGLTVNLTPAPGTGATLTQFGSGLYTAFGAALEAGDLSVLSSDGSNFATGPGDIGLALAFSLSGSVASIVVNYDTQAAPPPTTTTTSTTDTTTTTSTTLPDCQTIPGQLGLVKPTKLAKFKSKATTSFLMPVGEVTGGTLEVFDTIFGGAGANTYPLTAGTWKGLGDPPGVNGWKYKGEGDAGDPCKVVLIKPTIVKGVCKGTAITLSPPFLGDMGVLLAAGDATYGARYGGFTIKNSADGFKRKDATAPGNCPAIPTTSTSTSSTTTSSTSTTSTTCPLAFAFDPFDDEAISAYWTSAVQGIGPSIAESSAEFLEISIPTGSTGDPVGARYESVCQLRGDYDIQVAYFVTPAAGLATALWPAQSGVRIALATDDGFTERVSLGPPSAPGDLAQYDRSQAQHQPLPHETYVADLFDTIPWSAAACVPPPTGPSTQCAIRHSDDPDGVGWHESGVLRLVRTGTTVTSYFDARGTWRPFHTRNVGSADDVTVTLAAFAPSYAFHHPAHPSGLSTRIGLQNFRINDGVCVCP